MYIISACLAGVSCRYDGKDNLIEDIAKLVKSGRAILVCPEQLGGLPTPREPSEIVKGKEGENKVLNKIGEDLTEYFEKGAWETLNIAKMVNSHIAILKSRSPSCGFGQIYDGSFSGKKKNGNGLTADLLSRNGIKVYTEENLPKHILHIEESFDKKEEENELEM